MAYPTPDIWYKFENDILDSSGNNNHGTEVGTLTYSASKPGLGQCKGPESVGFTNYINAEKYLGITGNDQWSFAFWLYSDGTHSGRIVEYGTNSFLNFLMIEITSGSKDRLSFGYGGGQTWSWNLTPDTWHHISVENYGPPFARFELYVNGVYWWYVSTAGMGALNIIEGGFHRVGYTFTGKMDNYMVWADVQLTEAQLLEVMAETNPIEHPGITVGNTIVGGLTTN